MSDEDVQVQAPEGQVEAVEKEIDRGKLDIFGTIMDQNSTLISLLGQLVFPKEKLRELITKGSKDKERAIKLYNLCDGSHTLTNLAKGTGRATGNTGVILEAWYQQGLLYKVELKPRGFLYKRLYLVEVKNDA
jgi:hypothetical protein